MTDERCWEWVKLGGVTQRCPHDARWRSSAGAGYCELHQLTGCTPIVEPCDTGLKADDFDRWLEFTFRASGGCLVVQTAPENTTRLTREQADRLVSHLAEVAHTLPPLWRRLGRPAPFAPLERD